MHGDIVCKPRCAAHRLRNPKGFARAVLWFALACSTAVAAEPSFPHPSLGATNSYGRNIQRTMRLLATSTPERRNTVRVLFYGQSITEQKWSTMVEDDLRARFPHANLIIENRALGGFASQMLVKTAESDLYPFHPDLLIFHVYGAHNTYEDIIRRTRERTTAEILMQTDHVTRPGDLTEETDPAKLPPAGKHWDAFMNHNWLPSVAKRYGAELCDQRSIWKNYLKENQFEPKQLLRDSVHLNAHGDYLMAECVKAYLRYDPSLGPAQAETWVKTFEAGRDVQWRDGKLRLEFTGNRIDLIASSGGGTATITIDGKKPSEFAALYDFTRALATPGGKWPVVAPITSKTLPVLEQWTMEAARSKDTTNHFEFSVHGSVTGEDGHGRSDQRFISKSRRVVIETNAWNVAYAMTLAGVRPVPERFTVKWTVVPHFADTIEPRAIEKGAERTITVAQGLANTRHVLEIAGTGGTPVAGIRVYTPPQ